LIEKALIGLRACTFAYLFSSQARLPRSLGASIRLAS